MTENVKTSVKGLVLSGGRSSRMGMDKADIRYGLLPQTRRVMDLLSPWCDEVLASRAPGQSVPEGVPESAILRDRFLDFGPLGGILTALCHDREATWLVVACDLPLLDARTLAILMNARNPQAAATAFLDASGEFPEPLCALWEPSIRADAFLGLARGKTCPRKILMNTRTHLLPSPGQSLFNANTPQERAGIQEAA
ncbi:MAG: hypothetical protein RL318_2640 [Fibrobacterota bacterium]|jgi:molybdopterin-guanine dinucleotide biosynthesis protein A